MPRTLRMVLLQFSLLETLMEIRVTQLTMMASPGHQMMSHRLQSSGTITNFIHLCYTFGDLGGRGNSTVVSVSVYQAGGPGSLPAQSACFRKVEFYHCAVNTFPPVPTTGSKKAVHVLLCLCNNACKRSLAISAIRVGHRVPLAAFCQKIDNTTLLFQY